MTTKIRHIPQPAKISLQYLIGRIVDKLRYNQDFFSYSILNSIKKGEPELNVILMIQAYINDLTSVCNMIQIFGVDLCDKIKNFKP